MDDNIVLEGSLLKLKKSIIGRFKWIPKYIIYDYISKSLKQYAIESKPKPNTKPSKIYELNKCTLFTYDEKPFAFTIVDDLNDKKSLTLAASNEDDYNVWISVLSKEKEELLQLNTIDIYNDNDNKKILPKLEGEIISQFFSQYDIRRDLNDPEPMIKIELLDSLILLLDDNINVNCGKYISRDVKIELDSFISLSEFIKWWLSFRANNQKTMKYNISDSIHFVGFISSHNLQKQTDISSLLKVRVPELVDIVSDWEYLHPSQDWDKSYQSIVSEIDSIEKASILKYEINLDGLEAQTQIDALQHMRLTACINLYKFLGDLNSTAIKIVEVIVEEYSLPDELKTIKKISESGAEEEEVYEYDNLLFRVAAVPGEEQDATPSIERHIELITDDEHHRNCARLAFHSTQELRKVVMDLREEDLLAKKKIEFERNLGFNLENDLKNAKVEESLPTPPHVSLSAIVDYCGFRIEVHNPMNEEPSNLIHGKIEDKNIYMSDSDIIQSLVQKIGDKMMIGTYTRDASTSSFAKKSAIFICPQMKIYKYRTSSDYYFTHTDLLLPQDLPQSMSSSTSIDAIELDTKKLRPELLKFLPSIITTNFCREDIKDQYELDMIGKSLESLHYLYMDHLPQTASMLDNMSYSVLDSYGLTKFLHDRGVNCRMMGILYSLSKVSTVKKTILIECISRSCKVLLNNALRQCARRGKAESIIALLREMSEAQDFIDHQASIIEDKKKLINDFFNLCLGNGSDSNTFWRGILADEVLKKFGIDLCSLLKTESDKASVHIPQLFIALQYHTGVICTNYRNISLKFEEADQPNPLTSNDFKTYFTVDSMLPIFCPGNCGKVALAGEALLGCQLYSDAIYAFRLRVSSYLLVGSTVNSPKFTTMLGHCIYLLALSYFLNGQLNEALDTLNLYMNIYLDESPLLSRMLSLVMSIKFTIGEVDEAMIIFEKALDMYTFCLDSNHPIIASHFCTLGDLYYNSRAYPQAKVMILLALESSRQVLGEEHVISVAYRTKLASLYMHEEKFKKAEELLAMNSLVCKSLSAKNVDCQKESIDIYFGLANSLVKIGNKDEAQKLLIKVKEMLENKNVNREIYFATTLLLSDIYNGKLQSDESQKQLEDAWFLLQHSKDLRMSSSGLVNISCQMLSCYMSTLDLNVRLLLENIEKEVDREILPVANMKLWDEACQIVIKALWTSNPREFVDNVINKYHSFEVMNDDSKKLLLLSDTLPQDSALSLAFQIAVLQKIYKNSTTCQFSLKNINI